MLKKVLAVSCMCFSVTAFAGTMLDSLTVNDMQETDCVAKAMTKDGKILASIADDARIKLNGRVIFLAKVKSASNALSFKNKEHELKFTYTGKTKEKTQDGATETSTPANLEFKGTLTPVTLKAICM